MRLIEFTDWSNTDPKYFYYRGIVAGVVFTLCLILTIYATIKNN